MGNEVIDQFLGTISSFLGESEERFRNMQKNEKKTSIYL